MLLITGGLGFIGRHTVRALIDQGERCVLLQRRSGDLPTDLADGALVEQGDVTDLATLRRVGERHDITGIVHLAGSMPWPPSDDEPVEAARTSLGGLFNIVEVAQEWDVRRLGLASTIGVYGGLPASGALTEELPLSVGASHLIPTFKKIAELLGGHLAEATGVEIVSYRISGTWGPGGHDDPFFPAPELARAAAQGREPDLSHLAAPAYADNALDLCYVKDTGRAIALLQTAEELHHATYNVASGRATSNAEVAAAIRAAVPEARIELPEGGSTERSWLDITRLQQDTGYRPAYDLEQAAADYVAWLRDGHDR